MGGCCSYEHSGTTPTCPVNGLPTRPVSRKTVESLLKPDARGALTDRPYFLCDAIDCDTIYVSAFGEGQIAHLITKNQLAVRVGIKETEDPVPLCYCFGYDRSAIRKDIRTKGYTDIPKIIGELVRAGLCHCEETNPSGGCCLGNIAKAIKEAEGLKEEGKLY